jgi:hypothetical protein
LFFTAEISIRSSSLGFSFHHERLSQHQAVSVPWGTINTASSAVRLGSSKSTVSFSRFKARLLKDLGHA